MIRSIRLAVRGLLNTPGFTFLSIAILALGIGATTAMFGVARTVLFKPLAYRQPEQLVLLSIRVPSLADKYPAIPISAAHHRLWSSQSRTLQSVAVVTESDATLSGRGAAEHVHGIRASSNLFSMLGVAPALGPGFSGDEEKRGREDVVVVSNHFWRRKLGADQKIIGQKLVLNGTPYEIAGVMPQWLPFPRGAQTSTLSALPADTDYWRPALFTKDELSNPMADMNFQGWARMTATTNPAQVQAELNNLEQQLKKDFPPGITAEILISTMQEKMAGEVRRPLLILLASVAMVLLVVCLNLMNLTLVRAMSRRRQWAIRLAMGASQRALIGETFLESLVLSMTGGALGCLLAAWLLALVRSNAPAGLPRVEELTLDWPALLIALSAAVGSSVLFGLWPAWRASHIDPQEALRTSSRSMTESRGGHRLGQILVAAEVALSVVLLLGAGLLLRSFFNTTAVNPGVAIEHMVTAQIELPPDQYKTEDQIESFYSRLLDRLKTSPGVEAAGAISNLPITGEGDVNVAKPCGDDGRPLTDWPMSNFRQVSPGYFRASGTPLKMGREFAAGEGKAHLVVLSENTAQRLWPGQNPLGRTICSYGDDKKTPYQVVGIVGNVRAGSLKDEPRPMVYFPDWGKFGNDMALTVRARGDAKPVIRSIQRLVAEMDPSVPVSKIRTMEEVVAESVADTRFQLVLLGAFAAAAVLLACLGIYGVLAFTVGRRTSEIGIRMALGARPAQVRFAMLTQGMLPVLAGLGLGLALSFTVGRVVESMLFGLHAFDPVTYAVAAFASLGAATLACLLPADRAARLNPVDALRAE